MGEKQAVDRLMGLLLELEKLLSGTPGKNGDFDEELAGWRTRMDRARSDLEPELTPGEREDLVRMSRRVQNVLSGNIQARERDKRVLLVRVLSSQAVRNALEGYRVPVRQGFFDRTV